jgi:hypothetical protein
MPGLSKVIVLDPDARASRQVQLGFEREGVPAAVLSADPGALELPGDTPGLVVVGGVNGDGLDLLRRTRAVLDDRRLDTPIVFAGKGVARGDAQAAGADEVVLQPAYLRDVVTIGRLLHGVPASQRAHLFGNLVELTGVYTLVRALTTLGRSATLTLIRGLRRGEIRFYHGEVTSAQVGVIHGQAALHQLLLWTDARFDFHHEDIVRRQQIPLSRDEMLIDAERFLESVRDSSGGLSPSFVLEPNLPRLHSLGREIPSEVYGVLRMFDGHRMLADVLEDSSYRVFETLRVAQRAVDAGLLRVVERQPARATWQARLAIEQWLVGIADPPAPREPVESGPIAAPDSGPYLREVPNKRTKKRRGKKRRVDTAPMRVAHRPAARPSGKSEIDWGALVPRVVGAEVGSLAGVVPSEHVSGEIVVESAQSVTRNERVSHWQSLATGGVAVAETATATASVVIHELVPVEASGATTARITAAPAATVVAHATVSDASGAITTRIAALAPPELGSEASPEAAVREDPRSDRGPTGPTAGSDAGSATGSVQAEIGDEPSDGVIRQHIATAETAPVRRRRLPSDPPDDDRPDSTTGEITTPGARVTVEPTTEPSILVADLATRDESASKTLPAAFSETEEAFFRAHDSGPIPAVPPTESFDDLDEGYRPVGFWGRLRGKPPRKPAK